MAVSRVRFVEKKFREAVNGLTASFRRVRRSADEPVFPGCEMTQSEAVYLLESQITSRLIDYVARELKQDGKSFYTIGSAGHEGNAMVGLLTRHTDPAFLHYRSGGFYMARARKVPNETPVFDTCLSLVASSEDPISGGRHKVWGSKTLNVPPQTSTIASHLPKAMGMAFFMDRRKIMEVGSDLPKDSLVVCSFGDASVNHASAVSAINSTAWCSFQHLPIPLLYVCEDNGIGISVRTPAEWIESNYANRAGITYFRADGLDISKGYSVVREAIHYCRTRRRPVFLHLKTIRLLGHAGSDVEMTYRKKEEIEAIEARDPILKTAQLLINAGVLSPPEVLTLYDDIGEQVRAAGREAVTRPRHSKPETIMAPIFPDFSAHLPAADLADVDLRREFWNGQPPEEQKPRHMGQLINWGLHDLCLAQKDVVIFGEDIAKKGGVYRISAQLYEKFGVGRIFNTVLDETSILGLAIGAGHSKLLPIPEIQYLAYLHNAIDQLRGEASSLQYFSNGQFSNPMVVRIAGFAYQRGFGGHFHNDNSFAALRDIPGLIMVTASNGSDMVRLMRTAVDMARAHGSVVVVIEPIALYMTKDLVDKGDWLCDYPAPGERMAIGEVAHHGPEDADTLVISYANGYYLSRQACHDLEKEGVATRILELRFLLPLNRSAIIEAAKGKKRVIIVDECRQTASLSEEIITILVEAYQDQIPRIHRVTGHDTFIPLGDAWECVLPSRQSIYDTIKEAIHG